MALVTLCDPQVNEQGRELTRHGSALFPIACYHDALSLGAVPWHWHPELEVFTVSGGTAIAAAGAERFAVCSGQGFFVNTQVLHAVWPQKGSDCRLHSAVFHPRLVGGNLDSVFWSKYLQPLLNKGGLRRGTGLDRVRAGIPGLRVSGPRRTVTVDFSTVPAPCPRLLVQTGQLAA